MLVGKDQHSQASGRGRGREEKQAGTLQDHQGGGGGRRNRKGREGEETGRSTAKIIITGRHARGNLKAMHSFPLPEPPRLGLDLLLRWNPRPPPSAARALPPGVAFSALGPTAQRRCHKKEALCLPSFSHLFDCKKLFSLSLSLHRKRGGSGSNRIVRVDSPCAPCLGPASIRWRGREK